MSHNAVVRTEIVFTRCRTSPHLSWISQPDSDLEQELGHPRDTTEFSVVQVQAHSHYTIVATRASLRIHTLFQQDLLRSARSFLYAGFQSSLVSTLLQ